MNDSKQMIDIEVAKNEINTWLDYKKIGDVKKEANKLAIEALVNAVCEGDLMLTDEKHLIQTLKFPHEGEQPVKQLSFKPRLRMDEIHSRLENTKSTDADARILAYVCALTGTNKQIIRKLDSEDYAVCQSIAIFFV